YINSGYATLDGTSMAAAHASGLVALYIAANGRPHSLQDVNRIRQAIVDGSQPQPLWHPGACSWPSARYPTFTTCADPNSTSHEPLTTPSESWLSVTIIGAGFQSGAFQLSFVAGPAYTYTVQYADTLLPPIEWSDLVATNCPWSTWGTVT